MSKCLPNFLLSLSIQKRNEEFTQASRVQVEAVDCLGNKAALESKETNTVSHPFSASSNVSVIDMDEFDTLLQP